MNRKYNLKLDLQFRCNNSIMKFNQFDNNTSDFFIKISNGGKSFDVEKAIVVLATIKPSGKVSSQFIEVKNDVIYADLKPSMKDEIGTYTAQAMLILEDERVVTDSISYKVEEDKIFSLLNDNVETTEEFTLLTDMLSRLSTIETNEEQRVINEAERILSEENRKIEEAKRVEAELIRQHEEADRAKYDATRESNENIRKQNESIRLANETNRIDEEAKRVEEEAKRVEAEQLRKDNYNFMTEDEERRRVEANAHKEAEKLRAQAENTRVNEEAKRRTTEQVRVLAENTRVSNENTREANELSRKTNETHRVEAETQRQNRYNSFIADAEANASNFENYTNTAKVKEEERKSNELDRKSQEARRVSNEVERISNENTRKANEKAREKNETSRQYVFENKVDEVDKKIIEINTTKDNFVSSISTKVDTKISEIDNVKDNFVSSVNTKVDSKISELDNTKSDMATSINNKVNEVENRFNALTSKQQQDAEVIDARDGETSLKARLDRDIEKAKQVYVDVEGSHISSDSSVGYAKDVEILGNTVQSASNLADIRSVGDKVEGQELYEIPVLSCGKNVWNVPISVFNGDKYIQTSDYSRKPGINLPQNSSWTLTFEKKSSDARLYVWKGDVLSRTIEFSWASLSQTFTLVDNEDGISFYAGNFGNSPYDIVTVDFKIQLEEGTQATPYEPYVEDKLTILSPTPLEKVGDVADRIIEKDGIWGVEKGVVDFSKIPKIWGARTNDSGLLTFECNIPKPYGDVDGNKLQIICSKLVGKDYNTLYNNPAMEGIGIKNYNNNLVIRINISPTKLISQDVNGITKYLDDAILKTIYNTPQFIPLPHDQQIKLRTFANKTNISFLTEVEGTIKAQVPKSLGATVNTHTEQISNLNKELDRVKKLEESTVSTVTTESDFTTVEATTRGYFEDVKLEGKTLVNKNILPNKTSTSGYVILYDNLSLDEGKTYTIINTFDTQIKINDASYTKGNFTFIANTKNAIRVLSSDGTSQLPANYWNILILEGDHTQNPPSYFEGLKSVGQSATTSDDGADEIVVSSVKGDGNLFNSDFWESGFISDSTGNYSDNIEYARSKKIRVLPNTLYTFKGYTRRIYYYDITGNFISKFDIGGGTFLEQTNSFTTPSNCAYIALRYDFKNSSSIITSLDMMKQYNTIICKNILKDGLTHQSDKKRLLYYNEETQTWEKPILREWDSIEKHSDGKYYYHQRSGELVLNGSEIWEKVSPPYTEDANIYFCCRVLDTVSVKRGKFISDRFNKEDVYNTDKEGLYIYDTSTYKLRINIMKSKLSTQDVEGFKKWLQANNVTVVYQLAQEKVYECTNIDLITYNGETNFIVESGVLSPRTTLKVHNNISNVVSLLQKKVSLLENNITSYMITQNRLMLASRYNADTVSFKVDVATLRNSFEYDNDLYELILNNILVGKDNYNREYIENLIIFYWMDFVISDEMHSTLFEIIEEQHNPKVIEEETPLI